MLKRLFSNKNGAFGYCGSWEEGSCFKMKQLNECFLQPFILHVGNISLYIYSFYWIREAVLPSIFRQNFLASDLGTISINDKDRFTCKISSMETIGIEC